jgi:hypothetical protein
MNTNANGGLIVDFPSTSFHDSLPFTQQKTVSFSIHSEGRYIKYPSEHERSLRWYTSKNQRRFRHQMIQDAVVASKKMADCLNNTGDQAFQDYVGLEHLISRDVEERYIAMRLARKKHAKIVLAEQRAQRRHRRVSVEDLAEVSRRSSQLERERVRKVGILVASIA